MSTVTVALHLVGKSENLLLVWVLRNGLDIACWKLVLHLEIATYNMQLLTVQFLWYTDSYKIEEATFICTLFSLLPPHSLGTM